MFEQLEIMRMARDMSAHAAARQSVVARNIANADTPGFRALDTPSFADTYRQFSAPMDMRATRSGHVASRDPLPNDITFVDQRAEASPNGNTVSLEAEMVKAAAVKREYDLSLAVYRASLDILRTSLGRSR